VALKRLNDVNAAKSENAVKIKLEEAFASMAMTMMSIHRYLNDKILL
jgi:hypothetical protein